jgi:hypothetical protein
MFNCPIDHIYYYIIFQRRVGIEKSSPKAQIMVINKNRFIRPLRNIHSLRCFGL